MSGDKYKTVWIDKDNAAWDTAPTPWGVKKYGPFTEAKVVPADAIVTEPGDTRWLDQASATAYIRSALGYTSANTMVLDDDLFERAEEFAGNVLQAVEYLRTHPPVDEAQVQALSDALYPHAWPLVGDDGVKRLARDLYLVGVRAPEVTE